MPRCASETDTGLGLGWTPPKPLPLRIETPRLVLRSYTLDDAPALFEAVSESRSHLLPWMSWARDAHPDVEATSHFITSQIMAARDLVTSKAIVLGIFEGASGRLLGGTGIHGVHRDTAAAETGYWVRSDATGRGIATESTAHVLSWALGPPAGSGLGLRRINIYCSAQNKASQRVPAKLGLRQEVHQRQDYFVYEVGVTDRLGWGVLADEWDWSAHRLRG